MKPEILQTIQAAGIELTQKGNRLWACCPFHVEKIPSFMVNHEKQRFKCFSCGESGDVVDFVQKLKGLTFKDACKYLDIQGGNFKASGELRRFRVLKEAFRKWENWYAKELCELIRLVNLIDNEITLENFGRVPNEVYLKKEIAQYHMDILSGDDTNLKIELWRSVTCKN